MPEYVDYAEYYDWDHVFTDDIPFYLEYAERTGSPILELACGTGRLLVPLAQAGYTVHGIDLSEKMLAAAREKIARKGLSDRISISQADMAHFDLPGKSYALAFVAVRSFMHLFTQPDQKACLSRVLNYLRPGGLFIVDVYAPNLSRLAAPGDGEFKLRREFVLPNGNRVVRKDRFVRNDYVNQVNESELLFEEYDGSGKLVRSRTVPLTTRYTFRFELQLLLENAGFEVVDLFGGYDQRPYEGTGEIIFVARKPTT
jgi:SAM-dependent methyltransferase